MMKSEAGVSKILVIILVVLVVLVAAGAGALFFMLKAKPPAQAAEPGEGDAAQVETTNVDIGEFLTNLADEGARRYLKVVVQLAVDDEKVAKELEEKNAEVRSQILGAIRSKTYAEVAGETGMASLADDILQRINPILTQGQAVKVFFIDFVIQ